MVPGRTNVQRQLPAKVVAPVYLTLVYHVMLPVMRGIARLKSEAAQPPAPP